ncbi:MAG: helix-turn-helix domain-containing protein [Sedimentisphaerales bacterium]|nr:helix-turn-helix domain-containing protein [Sedimentisphaerales bacterium]
MDLVKDIPYRNLFETEQDWNLYKEIFGLHHYIPYTPAQSSPAPEPALKRKNMWINEAIAFLGLDRTGIRRPDKAIHRLINKGALHPVKIGGRLAFDISELDMVLANGDQKRGRGRPRK